MTGIWRVIKSDRDVVDKMTDAVGAREKKKIMSDDGGEAIYDHT